MEMHGSMYVIIAIIVVISIIMYRRIILRDNFGVCSGCDHGATKDLGTNNPFIWPCSGSQAIQNKFVWTFTDPNKKPINTTDDAEALLPNNISGMQVLTVPDQEYLTN